MKTYLKKVLWFTGLSGSGKSTLAGTLARKLKKKNYKGLKVDGDIFRKKTLNKNSFSKINIIKNNNLVIDYIKNRLEKYDYIIVAVISPLKITRIKARKIFRKNYIEIFVNCSLKELIKRDTKGLYELARQKKIDNLIGYKSKILYENTNYKKIMINTENLSLTKSLKKIVTELRKKFEINV